MHHGHMHTTKTTNEPDLCGTCLYQLIDVTWSTPATNAGVTTATTLCPACGTRNCKIVAPNQYS